MLREIEPWITASVILIKISKIGLDTGAKRETKQLPLQWIRQAENARRRRLGASEVPALDPKLPENREQRPTID